MSKPNPYKAPQADQYVAQPAPYAPVQGIWSDGDLLVVSKNVTLPAVCVVTNGKPVKSITRNYYWHHPAIYISILGGFFIFIILALVLRKSHKLDLPLSTDALQKRKKGLLISWAMAGLSVLALIGSFYLLAFDVLGAGNAGIGVMAITASFIGLLIAAVFGSRCASVLRPKKITDQASWFRGVSRDYLNQLPNLPPNVS